MDVRDFLHFQAALERDRIIEAAADKEHIMRVRVLRGKPLDPLLVLNDAADLLRQLLHRSEKLRLTRVVDPSVILAERNREDIHRDQLAAVGLRRRDGDLRARIRVHDVVRLARDRGAEHVDNRDRRDAALLRETKRCQRVSRLSRLGNDDNRGIRLENRISVSEFRGKVHIHRNSRELFDHVFTDHADMIRGPARDDIQPLQTAEFLLIHFQHGKIDEGLRVLVTAVLYVRIDRVLNGLRLLVDLLHHEVLIAALLSCRCVPLDGLRLLLDLVAVQIIKCNAVLRQSCELKIIDVIDLARVV